MPKSPTTPPPLSSALWDEVARRAHNRVVFVTLGNIPYDELDSVTDMLDDDEYMYAVYQTRRGYVVVRPADETDPEDIVVMNEKYKTTWTLRYVNIGTVAGEKRVTVKLA